jgi:hypothetical protein
MQGKLSLNVGDLLQGPSDFPGVIWRREHGPGAACNHRGKNILVPWLGFRVPSGNHYSNA